MGQVILSLLPEQHIIMSKEEKFLMAKTIWGEARGESPLGQEAVAWVIQNRHDDPAKRYGYGIAGVCLKPYQFACWNKGDPNLPQIEALNYSSPQIPEMMSIAERVMNKQGGDPTNGATHFFAPGKIPPPHWASGKQPSATIGNHVFYNNVD